MTTCLLVGLALILIRQYWTVKMGMRGLIMTDAFQGIVAYVIAALVCLVLLSGVAGGPISMNALAQVPIEFLRVPGDGDAYGPFYLFSLIFTGVVGSLCWPMSFQRIYTASGVRAVKAGTIRTVLISSVFYTLLMLLGIAASQMPEVIANPQAAWFTIMESYGGTWLLGLGVTMVFAASMGHIDGSVKCVVCKLRTISSTPTSANFRIRHLPWSQKSAWWGSWHWPGGGLRNVRHDSVAAPCTNLLPGRSPVGRSALLRNLLAGWQQVRGSFGHAVGFRDCIGVDLQLPG
ncbi:hypothetical protein ACETU7_10895 [Rhodococcus sp. 3Y1]